MLFFVSKRNSSNTPSPPNGSSNDSKKSSSTSKTKVCVCNYKVVWYKLYTLTAPQSFHINFFLSKDLVFFMRDNSIEQNFLSIFIKMDLQINVLSQIRRICNRSHKMKKVERTAQHPTIIPIHRKIHHGTILPQKYR